MECMTSPIEQSLPPVPADVPADWVADNLAELQEMNGEDWETLQESGVEADSAVRLEFAFTAPNEEQAGDLADQLLIGDYEAQAAPPDSEFAAWTVTGTTGEGTVTPAGLEEWLRRMIATGWQHGESTLDGWSAVLG
jgi:Regulator of ribonuclease activity B